MKYTLIILAISCAACQQTAEVKAVPEDKIAKMMAEIAVAEGAINLLNGYQKDSLAQVYYQQIYDMNGMTIQEYEEYLRILSADTKRMESVVKNAEKFLNDKMPSTAQPAEEKK